MAKEKIPVQEAPAPLYPEVDPDDPVQDLFLHRKVMGRGYIDDDAPTPPPSAPVLEEGEESFLYMRRPQVLPDAFGKSGDLARFCAKTSGTTNGR